MEWWCLVYSWQCGQEPSEQILHATLFPCHVIQWWLHSTLEVLYYSNKCTSSDKFAQLVCLLHHIQQTWQRPDTLLLLNSLIPDAESTKLKSFVLHLEIHCIYIANIHYWLAGQGIWAASAAALHLIYSSITAESTLYGNTFHLLKISNMLNQENGNTKSPIRLLLIYWINWTLQKHNCI